MKSDNDGPARALRRAVKAGDIKEIRAADERLQATTIDDLLTQLETAIREDRTDDAQMLLEELATRYKTRTDEASATVASAEVARSANDVSFDTVQSLTSYLRTATKTNLQRSELLTRTASYLDESGSVTDSEVVVDSISNTRNQEQTFQTETDTARSTVEGVSLPPKLTISTVEFDKSQIAPGSTVETVVGVVNVGDEPVTDLAVSLSLPDGLSSATGTKSLGELAAGANTTIEFAVTGEQAGFWTVEMTAQSPDANQTSASETLVVTEEATTGPVDRADQDGDGEIDTDELTVVIRKWARGEFSTDGLIQVIQTWARDG